MKHQCITNPEGTRVLWGNIDKKFARKDDTTGSANFYKEGEGIVPDQTVVVSEDTFEDFLVWANLDTTFERAIVDSNNESTYAVITNIEYKNGRWMGVIVASPNGIYKIIASNYGNIYEIRWSVYTIDPNQVPDLEIEPLSISEMDALWESAQD